MDFKALRGVILVGLFRWGSSSTSSIDSATSGAIPKPECDDSVGVSFRYDDVIVGVKNTTGSFSYNVVVLDTGTPFYVEAADLGDRGGCVTVGQIWDVLGGVTEENTSLPLYPVDPDSGAYINDITGTWLLERDLYVLDGITLQVWGPDSGGNVTELRLKSNAATSDTNATFTALRTYGGGLDFENTKVVGWDTVNNTYDSDSSDGRSHITAITQVTNELSCDQDGARMDVVNSEMAYLGFCGNDTQGLSWKVDGLCARVYGNIYDSELHHTYIAVYMNGQQQGDIRRNELYSNEWAGIWAIDNSNSLTIHNNSFTTPGGGLQLSGIYSEGSSNISIQNNDIFGGGILYYAIHLTDGSDYAVVKGNYVYNARSTGIRMEGNSNATISNNVVGLTPSGISLFGCDDNIVYNNTISRTTNPAIQVYLLDAARPQRNVFDSNTISGTEKAFRIYDADGFNITNNKFTDSKTGQVDRSTGVVMTDNVGLHDITITLDEGAELFMNNPEF